MRKGLWILGLSGAVFAAQSAAEVAGTKTLEYKPEVLAPVLPSEAIKAQSALKPLAPIAPKTAAPEAAPKTPSGADPNPAVEGPIKTRPRATAPLTDPKFTFKRVGVPQAGQKKRLTIQINPKEQAAALAALPAWEKKSTGSALGGPPAPSEYDWYWKLVSPAMSDRIGRFPSALTSLTKGPAGTQVPTPRLAALQEIAQTHGRDILAATIGTEVSPALVLAVISVESAGRPQAVSHAGAVGLMQLIPATAARFNVADSTDPRQNIKGGVAYLDWLMKEFDRDPMMVIAAYNSGENAVKSAGGVPPFAETRGYVPKVLAAWDVARGLCVTRPELVSDGCVFALKG